MKITVTKHYGGVILAGGLLALQHYYNGFGIIVPLRKLLFNENFMSQWKDMHQYYFKTDPSPNGYPDAGAGVYSKAMNYSDWHKFNCAQRVHGNSVEHLVHSIPCMLLAGLFYPKIVTILGLTMFAGREMYMNGYLREGPNSKIRHIGGVAVLAPEIMILGFLMGVGLWRGVFRNRIMKLKFIERRRLSMIDQHINKILKEEERAKALR